MPDPPLIEVDFAPQRLEQDLAALLAAAPDVTALFASNDMLALAAVRALRALGRHVPRDVAVVGFDGIALSELVDPPLATVRTPNDEMGRTAARSVIAAIDGAGIVRPESLYLPFSFRSGCSLEVRQRALPAAGLVPPGPSASKAAPDPRGQTRTKP